MLIALKVNNATEAGCFHHFGPKLRYR